MSNNEEIKVDPLRTWAKDAVRFLGGMPLGGRFMLRAQLEASAGELVRKYAEIEQAERNAENAPGEDFEDDDPRMAHASIFAPSTEGEDWPEAPAPPKRKPRAADGA